MKAEYVDHMGNDLTVVNSARVSFAKESDFIYEEQNEWDLESRCIITYQVPVGLKEKDKRLIKFLAENGHWTPFAHPQITLRMQAPVPIRVQCFKHKQGFAENEESRRYISSTPNLFIPECFRSKPEGNIKQGSGDKHPRSYSWKGEYIQMCSKNIELYEEMIADGVAPEQARFVLPQGVEVNWIWTGSLAAYARFVNLRKDSHAQGEIQQLADEVESIIRPLYPVSWYYLVEAK